ARRRSAGAGKPGAAACCRGSGRGAAGSGRAATGSGRTALRCRCGVDAVRATEIDIRGRAAAAAAERGIAAATGIGFDATGDRLGRLSRTEAGLVDGEAREGIAAIAGIAAGAGPTIAADRGLAETEGARIGAAHDIAETCRAAIAAIGAE